MNKLCIVGELRPKSRFLGNSVSTVMEGENRVYLLGRPEDGREYTDDRFPGSFFPTRLSAYVVSMPNMYARGILFGKMVIELGDACTAKCEKSGVTADLEFKTKVRHLFIPISPPLLFERSADRPDLTFFLRVKGFFSGIYNAIGGRVRHGQVDIGEIGGRWSHIMDYKSTRVRRLIFQPSVNAHVLVDRPVRSVCCLTLGRMGRSSPQRLWSRKTNKSLTSPGGYGRASPRLLQIRIWTAPRLRRPLWRRPRERTGGGWKRKGRNICRGSLKRRTVAGFPSSSTFLPQPPPFRVHRCQP